MNSENRNCGKRQDPEIVSQLAEAISEKLLGILEDKEAEIDDEIRKLVTFDDDELERLRDKKLQELKQRTKEREKLILAGHGKYEEIQESELFTIAKQSLHLVSS